MKVILYTVNIYQTSDPLTLNSGEKQIRIFVPDKGIFAFRKQKNAGEEKIIVDFFTDNSIDIGNDKEFLDAIQHIEQNETNVNDKFIAAIELPDNFVNQIIAVAKKFQASKKIFETYAKNLFAEAEINRIILENQHKN